MGFGASLILIAAGAILAWAVNVDTSGVNLNTVGYVFAGSRSGGSGVVAGLLVDMAGTRVLHALSWHIC